MSFRLSALWTRHTERPVRRSMSGQPFFRPVLEGFEDRVVPAAPALSAAQVGHAVAGAAPVIAPTFNLNALQLNVSGIQVLSDNTLGALVNIGNVTQIVPIDLSATPNPDDPNCPILNLELGPIHLDLLGLNVDTSQICLDVVAHENGGLLGDLLCGVSNLLNGGTSLTDILGGLTSINPSDLLGGLTNLLDSALGSLGTANVLGVGGTAPGVTDILNLAVGPLDLNLLGLEVSLDDCNGGPVTVDITAEAGSGKLLGNLLSSVAHLLDGPSGAVGNALNNQLDRIEGLIGGIVQNNA
jgi:hypothetical protein